MSLRISVFDKSRDKFASNCSVGNKISDLFGQMDCDQDQDLLTMDISGYISSLEGSSTKFSYSKVIFLKNNSKHILIELTPETYKINYSSATTNIVKISLPDTSVPPKPPSDYVPKTALAFDDEKYQAASKTDGETSTSTASEPKCYSNEDHSKFMDLAIKEAFCGVERGDGGPFGAVIIEKATGKIISRTHNSVWITGEPSSHAEVTAIRHACRKLGRLHLTGCVLYTSAYPCTMCFATAYWAKLDAVYYGAPPPYCSRLWF